MATDLRAIAHGFQLPSLFPGCQRIGDNRYKVACIAHEERTPSMIVTYHREYGWRAHCFGCGWDGDAVDVVMRLERCSFKEALAKLDVGDPVAAPEQHVKPRAVIVCDLCLTVRVEAEGRDYKMGVSTATFEAMMKAERLGWMVSTHAAVCADCLESMERRAHG